MCSYQANQFESIGFITGGSGVTPSYQIAQTIDANPDDKVSDTILSLEAAYLTDQIYPRFLQRYRTRHPAEERVRRHGQTQT